MDVSNQLSHYEMSKLLTGPYDKEGACIMIKSAPGSKDSEVCIYYYRKICFLVDGWMDSLALLILTVLIMLPSMFCKFIGAFS